jgi:hypothetical protein
MMRSEDLGTPLLRRAGSFLAALGGLVLAVTGAAVDHDAWTVAGIVIGLSASLLAYLPTRAPSGRRETAPSTSDITALDPCA